MAKVLEPISDTELKKITVVNLRNEYKKLANSSYLWSAKEADSGWLDCDRCFSFNRSCRRLFNYTVQRTLLYVKT